jgi:DMSO/TMAO reductase YedYZ molybdopterin-dependent catalytic subunit
VTDEAPHRVGRGVFLATVAGGVTSLFWGKAVWDRVSHAVSPVGSLVPLLPSGGWRIYTVSGSLPRFDEETWRLRIGGHVRQQVSLSYRQLLALPKSEQVSTFHCVTGWSVENVRWGGVRLHDVLEHAQPLASAHALEFVSAETPYVDSLTVEQAGLHDVMLAYEMDGRPLSRAHGAPLRLVIPEMYGYKNVKWLAGINLVPRALDGYWEQLGYDRDAWVGRSNGYGA